MALPDSVTSLVQQINEVSTSTDAPLQQKRVALLDATRKLVKELEDSEEEARRFIFQPLAHACLCAASKCGIIKQWPKSRMNCEQIASMTGADKRLVVRLLRALEKYDIFTEVDEELYEHNARSIALCTEPLNRNLLPMALRILPGIARLPDFLETILYRNPGDNPSDRTLFSYSNNTDLDFFEWLAERPEQLAAFNKSMSASIAMERASSEKGFADMYPFQSELGADVASDDEVVLVDIGGGYGQVLEDIRTHLPELKGRMVLEDLPKTVEKAVSLPNVDIVPYNFFTTEQPVKGARAYLLRHVLVDWSDEKCRQILRNTIPALEAGKSRLLFAEIVIDARNASFFCTMMDINLMRYSGSGRTEKQWRKLLGSVGLSITKILPPGKYDSIMEAVPSEWLREK